MPNSQITQNTFYPAMNTNILLALLLGLQEVELTPETKSSLKQLSRLIKFKSDWEDIQEQLDTILANNVALNQNYQVAKGALDALDSQTIWGLLPTKDEIKQTIFLGDGERGYHPGEYDGKDNYEIGNDLIMIINQEEPAEVSKTLLQRLRDSLATFRTGSQTPSNQRF